MYQNNLKDFNKAEQKMEKKSIKKIVYSVFCVIFIAFFAFNVLLYIGKYSTMVKKAPEHLKEARVSFVNAFMLHIYYSFFVKTFRMDFNNPCLVIFKAPKDYFYKKALDKLPKNEGEGGIYFDVFKLKPYNATSGGKYGNMAMSYGKDFAKNFIDELYKSIKIASINKIDQSYKNTNDVGLDVIEAYSNMINVFVYEAHLSEKHYMLEKPNLKKYANDKELHEKFVEIYQWQEEFFDFYQKTYPLEFAKVFSKNRGLYSPYYSHKNTLILLPSFILLYKIINEKLDCSYDAKYFEQIEKSKKELFDFIAKYDKSGKILKAERKTFDLIYLKNRCK